MKRRHFNQVLRVLICSVIGSVTIISGGTAKAFAAAAGTAASLCGPGMSQLDCAALYGNWEDWVPDNGEASSCLGTGSSALVGETNEDKIWNWLTGKGLTAVQAAGVMGNMQVESASTWSPTIHQVPSDDVWNSNYGNGWGIVQWDGGRRYNAPDGGVLGSLRKNQPTLVKYVDSSYDPRATPALTIPQGDEDALLSFELNYVYQESTHRPVTATGFGKADNEWDTLKLQTTVDNATVFWHNNFEVSSDTPQQVLQDRGGDAHDIYTKYSGTSPTGDSSDAPTSCAATGTLSTTVLAFAWPQYHPPTYLDREPAYATAISQSEAKGLYVGDNDGIDCGGFVTTLMIYSGFEPKYNDSGHGGNTTVQEEWLKKNWTDLGSSSSINVADLQPGDVAIASSGGIDHTFVWVGDIPDFGAKIASASTGSGYQRAPMADTEQSPTEPGFEWFRKN